MKKQKSLERAKEMLPNGSTVRLIRYNELRGRCEVQYKYNNQLYYAWLSIPRDIRPIKDDVFIYNEHTTIRGIEAVGGVM